MRNKLENLIDKEIKFAREGKPAYLILKINNLVDVGMINTLYYASQNGVKIQLIIRGICGIVPGLPGISENIEAISIVDKYLEHSRVLILGNGGDEKIYISSADWMSRNLDNRVEVACPVYDPEIKNEIRNIINIQLRDNVKARIIDQCQGNTYLKNNASQTVRSQFETYNYYKALI
jgi:polyphosphate kinase